jgi:hypothetical protein
VIYAAYARPFSAEVKAPAGIEAERRDHLKVRLTKLC